MCVRMCVKMSVRSGLLVHRCVTVYEVWLFVRVQFQNYLLRGCATLFTQFCVCFSVTVNVTVYIAVDMGVCMATIVCICQCV